MEEFSFPFEPYDIQLKLMRQIQECLENRNIGIFESPTGTGKSLSVLCSTLTWLENEENRKNREIDDKIEKNQTKIKELDNSEDWVEAHRKKIEINREQDELHEKLQKRKRISDRIERAKKGEIDKNSRKRKTKPEDDEDLKNLLGEEHDELAPDENYSSDSEGLSTVGNGEQEEEAPLKCLKIFYASRTHSQLEQLIEELEKTRFRPRIVTCAARGTLCANDDVRKLKLNHLINEKCMELRKNGGEKKTKPENSEACKKKKCATSCQFYNTTQIEEVVNGILANQLKNTQEVAKFGKKSQGCPYFATRKSIGVCQLVLLPYQVILHNAARDAWGIDLDENVVILDEAHNVLNTIGSLYSSEISVKSLTVALKLIREYIEVYKLRLKAKNLLYMRQLQNVTQAMLGFLNCANNQDQVMTIPQFAGKLNIAQINLFKLSTYIEKSDLCKKFHGFYMRQKKLEVAKGNEPKPLSGIAKLMSKKNEDKEMNVEKEKIEEAPVTVPTVPSPLFSLKAFIDALNNKCEDGRIVVEKQTKFRYMLLNPADRLAEVVNSARATILVGGTMEPAQLLVETLSRGALNKQITRFSCNHVIDDDQLLSVVVDRTVDGKPFKLTYETRSNEQVLKSLAISLRALVPQLPNGVVIFVPSYDFLYMFQKKLAEFGLVEKFQKPIFTESRQPTSDVWEKFSRAAKTEKGAVLMAVVGGKMSEGINFCDELGRAVIVIGLPYPNRTSVELRERMRFLDLQMKNGGNLLYESLCMHAVNQAIGRAIRHRRDYASVYLFDERFKTSKSKLSAWIGQRTLTDLSFQQILQKTKTFFDTKH